MTSTSVARKVLPEVVRKKIQDSNLLKLLEKLHGHTSTGYGGYSHYDVIDAADVPGHQILLVLFWYESASEGTGVGWYYKVEAWQKSDLPDQADSSGLLIDEGVRRVTVAGITMRHESNTSRDNMNLDINAIKSIDVRDKKTFDGEPIKEVVVHFNEQKRKREAYYQSFVFYIRDEKIISRESYEGDESRWNKVHHPNGWL